ncbi:Transmembrane domain-containing protein [Brazilian cedratvirus IHUMI]|uniref:Transmembrane domain-containing protein n=1 Tax=Brazilian cedratvirus IHUMI TaxID=2126980 RepID=A0A2R8FD12_9VIRU|nr:Transmembrane domain-containing protein [Brazilian cedratvirus IHUMI]
MDENTQAYAISVLLVGLITFIIVWLYFYFGRNSMLSYQEGDVKIYLPLGSSFSWQVALFTAIVAAFAAAVAFF